MKPLPASEERPPQAGAKGRIALSLLIIAVGIGWLLTAQGVAGNVNWVWTLSLAVLGAAVFLLSGGVDKVSMLLGPFFLIASIISVLRQTQQISMNVEMPILIIVVGALLLIVQAPIIPAPRWLAPPR